jgi:hypothetical protein
MPHTSPPTKCKSCRYPTTWREQRVQFGRLTRRGWTADEIATVQPICGKCATRLLNQLDAETVPAVDPVRPSHIPASPPPGVPALRWARAVELIRSEADSAPSYWALWCVCYRKFLRGYGDAVTFGALFREYEQAGGRGSPFDPSPPVATDERTVNETTSDT